MCGFFQVVQRSGQIDRARFRKALASMQHRGPDQSGEVFLTREILQGRDRRDIHFAFGHQRLSILDLSERSKQPFVIGRDVLLYNGEIYNYRELNNDLSRHGQSLETSGDTETLFKSILEHDVRALSSFNGMWAFSLYREKHRQILLSRDRYGKKPLFFYQDRDRICISSTIYAIQLYLQRPPEFRRDLLVDYLTYGTLYPSGTQDTHYHDISQILPGHWGSFDLEHWEIRQEPYFSFHDEETARETEPGPEQLVELVKESVRCRLVSDRPVGLLLSGGIDSTLVLATLYALGLQEQCRIFMGDTGKSEDYAYARRCTEQLGIHAETVVLDYDHNTFERFLEVCRHMEKPVSLNGSSMAMPQMYEVISSHGVPVVLDGTGGDEIFGGYWQRQFPNAVRDAVRQRDWAWVRSQWQSQGGENPVKSYLFQSLLPARLVAARNIWKKKTKALAYPYFKADARSILKSSPADPLMDLSLTFTEAMCMDVAPGGRLGEWLWHNDRNSMMSSVEGRSPLLDYRLNRFIYGSPRNKFSDSWNKLELRQAFDALAPIPSQWRRQKQGFRWDGKHFLYNNKERILALIRENRCLEDIVDIPKLLSYAGRHPKLLRSSFFKQVLAISGVEHGLSSF